MWRGGLARRRVKFLRAVYQIMGAYRRYKMRAYMWSIIERFQDVRRMPDLGKSVRWPVSFLRNFLRIFGSEISHNF